jgi:membrane carboxypeptidase/penicillin-binding protein
MVVALYRIDPQTGKKRLDHFNRAVQAYRQPGSSFKPYVYAAALEMGFKPNSLFKRLPHFVPHWQRQVVVTQKL